MNVRISILLIAFSFMLSSCGKNPVGPMDYSDGEYILFIRNNSEVNQICTIKPDGTDLRVIAEYQRSGAFITEDYQRARWSPDKSYLVVEGGPRESREWTPLWLMDMRGELVERIIWAGRLPIWSKDGGSVIYTRRGDYFTINQDIYRTDLGTLEEEVLIKGEITGIDSFYYIQALDLAGDDPARILVFEMYMYVDSLGRLAVDTPALVSYDYLSYDKIYLTDESLHPGNARISPDGNWIAFIVINLEIPGLANQIFLMNAAGDNMRALTSYSDTIYYHELAWSPDGRKLAYTANFRVNSRDVAQDIYVVAIEGGSVTKLTHSASNGFYHQVMDWK